MRGFRRRQKCSPDGLLRVTYKRWRLEASTQNEDERHEATYGSNWNGNSDGARAWGRDGGWTARRVDDSVAGSGPGVCGADAGSAELFGASGCVPDGHGARDFWWPAGAISVGVHGCRWSGRSRHADVRA